MPNVLDLEQALLLLEIAPPFDKRQVQLARRRMAKVWHPDIAPPGKQFEHERHLKAINEAADQLERLAEGSRGGKVSRNAVKVNAAAARAARAEEGRRAYEEAERQRAQETDRRTNDPFGSQVPDHSVVHRYARCVTYPEWGVGSVTGIYFTGGGDDIQQWARVKFAPGVRTVPAGSLQFVDFSKPDPGADRVAALPDRGAARDRRGQPRARGAAAHLRARRRARQRRRPAAHDARVLAGGQPAGRGARGPRLGARRPRPPDPAPLRRAHLRGHGRDRPRRRGGRAGGRCAAPRTPTRGSASDGCGCGSWTATARSTRWNARAGSDRRSTALLDLALAYHLAGDLGAEVTACEQATILDDRSPEAWSRYAHALARTDRVSDAIDACDRALRLGADPEVAQLLHRLQEQMPRVLPAA